MITASPRPYAVVVTPVLPYPPVAGGHKRILRLAEAIARAGAVPHLLTEDPASPDGADALRDRGWRVDVLPAAPQGVRGRTTQHVVRRPMSGMRRGPTVDFQIWQPRHDDTLSPKSTRGPPTHLPSSPRSGLGRSSLQRS